MIVDDEDDLGGGENPLADDLCDVCGSSGVEVDHTHSNGDTVCTECAQFCIQEED